MKKQVKNFMLLMFTLCAVSLGNAQEKSTEFEVLGNCNGCKKRIEKAANSIEGVASASWNKDSKIIEVAYDSEKTSLEDISKAINEVGHDTKFGKASDSAYDAFGRFFNTFFAHTAITGNHKTKRSYGLFFGSF